MRRVRRTATILQGAVSVARCFRTCCLPLALVLALQLPAGLSPVFSWYGCHLGTPRTEARRRGGGRGDTGAITTIARQEEATWLALQI